MYRGKRIAARTNSPDRVTDSMPLVDSDHEITRGHAVADQMYFHSGKRECELIVDPARSRIHEPAHVCDL